MATENDDLRQLRDQVMALQARVGSLEQFLNNPLPVEPAGRLPSIARAVGEPPVSAPVPLGVQPPPHVNTGPPPIPQIGHVTPRRVVFSPPRPAQSARSLESVIGQNWTSWIGGIVFLLGVCFFLKYAWDQGWIRPTPAMRVLAALATGAAFCAFGEWMHRKQIGGVLSATFYGVGFAILMAALFGAHTFFEVPVISQPTAFIGVAVVALLGVLSAMRINAMTLAGIALLGAYLSPAILSTGQDRSVELLTYLAIVTSLGLVVTYLRLSWSALRWFCWIACALWTIAWLDRFGLRSVHETLAVGWIVFVYMAFLGQLVASLHKLIPADQDQLLPAVRRKLRVAESNLSVLSLFNSAAAFAGLWPVLNPSLSMAGGGLVISNPMAMVALGLAAVQAVMIFTTPSITFARVSTIQSMALVTLAAPLLFGQFAITLAWLVLCLTIAVTARITQSPALRRWSVVLLVLSMIRLFAFDMDNGTLRQVLLTIDGRTIIYWSILACGTAVLAHVLASLNFLSCPSVTRVLHSDRKMPDVLAWLGTGLFVIAVARVSTGDALTTVAIAWCAIVIALCSRLPYLAPHAFFLGGIIWLKWLIIDELMPAAENWQRPTPELVTPVFNTPLLNCLLLLGLIVWLSRRPIVQTVISQRLRWASIGVTVFLLVNLEICHAGDWLWVHHNATFENRDILKHVSMSVAWGLIGFGLVIAGFVRKVAALRWSGLILLGATLAKILLIDMAEVKAFYRILSFMVTGALLLAVSYAYHKQMKNPAEPSAANESA